jgi:osmotically inducible lipoprotein OsmB
MKTAVSGVQPLNHEAGPAGYKKEHVMKKFSIALILIISLTVFGCAGMSNTQQRTLSGGAVGTGVGAIAGAVAGHTVWGAAIGAAAGAASGYLYDHYEKTKEAEYHKGYQAGQQSAQRSQ